MQARCAELQDAILDSGLTGDSATALVRDVQAEVEMLDALSRRSSTSRVRSGAVPGCAIGAGVGLAGGVTAGLVGGGDPQFRALVTAATALLGLLAGSATGCLIGALVGAAGYSNELGSHRDAVNGLVERYNRLAARRHRRGPCAPGRLL